MTREEAIELLHDMKDTYDEIHENTNCEIGYEQMTALDMAIEALSAEAKTKCVAQIKVDTEEVVRRIKEEYDITDGWIPCSERLPYEHICDDGYVEPSEKVLVCTDSETILTSRYWGNRQSKAEDPDRYADWVDIDWWHNVVAWMPLPKPYKGGDTE